MNKNSDKDWKTPLGYYERAIEELRRKQEELQVELQNIKTIQDNYFNLKLELKTTQKELDTTKVELKATQKELDTTKVELKATQKELDTTKVQLKETQRKADSAISKIESVKSGIENGSIVAQKALMIRGKNEQYWIRFCSLDSVNHHWLQVWKTDDTWHDDIRVKATSLLQARDDQHWMRFNYLKDGKYDTYHVWQRGNIWHHTIRVETAKRLKH